MVAAGGQLPSVLAHCSQDGHYKRAADVSSLSWRARLKSLWDFKGCLLEDDAERCSLNGCGFPCACCACFRKLGFSDVF